MTGSQNTPEDLSQELQELAICKEKSPSPGKNEGSQGANTPGNDLLRKGRLMQEYRNSPSAAARMRALKMLKEKLQKPDSPDLYRDELDLVTADERAAAEREITLEELFQGICLFIDVRTAEDNRSAGIQQHLSFRGIKVTTDISTATHIIFKDGLKSTFAKGKELNLPFVSLLWIDACKKFKALVDYKNYPVIGIEKYEDPILCKKIKRKRSMQPAAEFVLRTPKRKRRPKTTKVTVEKPVIDINFEESTPAKTDNRTIRTPKTIEVTVHAKSHARVESTVKKNGETVYYSSDEMEMSASKHKTFKQNATRLTVQPIAFTPKSATKEKLKDKRRETRISPRSIVMETPRRLLFEEQNEHDTVIETPKTVFPGTQRDNRRETRLSPHSIVVETPRRSLFDEQNDLEEQITVVETPKPIFVEPMMVKSVRNVLKEKNNEQEAILKGPINSTVRFSSALHDVHFDTNDISSIVMLEDPTNDQTQPTQVEIFQEFPPQISPLKALELPSTSSNTPKTPLVSFKTQKFWLKASELPSTSSNAPKTPLVSSRKSQKTPKIDQTKLIPKPRRKRKLFNPNLTPQLEVHNDKSQAFVPPTPQLPSLTPVNANIGTQSSQKSTQNSVKSSPKRPPLVFVATALDYDGRKLLKLCAKQLSTKKDPVEIQSFVDKRATHLIMQPPYGKTKKLLMAIIRGMYVLNVNYLQACLEAKKWLPEETFEVKNFLAGISYSRAEREIFGESYVMRIFTKTKFYVHPELSAGVEDITEFIELCSGIVTNDPDDANYQIRDEFDGRWDAEIQIGSNFVTDSIGAAHRKCVKNYLLFRKFCSQSLSSQRLVD